MSEPNEAAVLSLANTFLFSCHAHSETERCGARRPRGVVAGAALALPAGEFLVGLGLGFENGCRHSPAVMDLRQQVQADVLGRIRNDPDHLGDAGREADVHHAREVRDTVEVHALEPGEVGDEDEAGAKPLDIVLDVAHLRLKLGWQHRPLEMNAHDLACRISLDRYGRRSVRVVRRRHRVQEYNGSGTRGQTGRMPWPQFVGPW